MSTISPIRQAADPIRRNVSVGRRSRSYCFTINNYSPEDIRSLDRLSIMATEGSLKYAIYGYEKGAEGTEHIQGYLYYKNAVSFLSIKALFPRAHIEEAKGSPLQNKTYCSKEGKFVEHGQLPASAQERGEAEKRKWDQIWIDAKGGNLDAIPAGVRIRCYRTFKEIRKDFMPPVADLADVCGIWYSGQSGVGKSRAARHDWPFSYDKMCNKWWDGYQLEDNVLMDDFDRSHSVLGHHLKRWADRYSFEAEVKGGAMRIRPKRIIVTSQYKISQIWLDEETQEALKRRFIEIDMDKCETYLSVIGRYQPIAALLSQ